MFARLLIRQWKSSFKFINYCCRSLLYLTEVPLEVFYKERCSQKLCKILRKNNCYFGKKRLWHRYFPVKFLRILFSQSISENLLSLSFIFFPVLGYHKSLTNLLSHKLLHIRLFYIYLLSSIAYFPPSSNDDWKSTFW